jgi:hypothetical protein
MIVLVDYDNLPKNLRRPGTLPDLCSNVLASITSAGFPGPQRCRFRLYGGWYDGAGFSRAAQRISAEIQGYFPTTVRWSTAHASGSCLAEVEMAYSLEVEPNRHLFHTLRTRPFGSMVTCDLSVFARCVQAVCPSQNVADFLGRQRCLAPGCPVTQSDLLRKTEQKLVDTMLSSDLVFLAARGASDLFVVSSDDDLWPGMRTAIGLGRPVTLIHTRKKRLLPTDYTSGLTASFKQLRL